MLGQGAEEVGAMPLPASELAHRQILAEAAAGLFGPEEASIRVGRYVLERPIGAGGMGEVFRARDPELQRTVAVKLLHARLVEADAQTRERSRREALALARIDHPNVVEVFEIGEHEGRPYVAMEFIEGRTLSDWLDEVEPSWRDVVAVYVAAGRGLAAAHRADLVHRDFKPDNVLVSGAGGERRVRVLDFGLARLVGADVDRIDAQHDTELGLTGEVQAEITEIGARLGTPAYMAPEQLRGEVADAASDQFSFCLALYRALWRVDPFPSARTSERLAAMERDGAKAPPSTGVGAGATRALWPIVRRGLAAARGDRWPELPALLDALERAVSKIRRRRSLGVAAVAVGVGVGVGFGLGATPRRDASGLALVREVRRVQLLAACDREARAVEELWTASARERISASFLASGHPGAGESWTRAEAKLDDYVRSWSFVRARVCVEATVEGRRDAASLERARACLDDAAVSLAVRVDALAELDELGLSQALESVFALPSPGGCADVRRVRPQPPAGVEPAQLRALRVRIERVHALRELARFADADADALPLLAETEALAWAPVEAEARDALGWLAFARGDYDAAETQLVLAYELALSSHDDELALQVATRLAWTVGVAARRFEDGRLWTRHAGALVTRLQLAGTVHEAGLATVRGLLAFTPSGRLEDLERAEALWRDALGVDHPRVAEAIKYRSRALVQLGREVEGLALLQRALDIQARSLGPHHPHVARTLIHIAEAERQRGAHDAAEAALERALDIQRHAFGEDHDELLETELARVRVLRDRGQLDAAASLATSVAERQAAVSGVHSLAHANVLIILATLESARGHHALAREQLDGAEACYRLHVPHRVAEIDLQRGQLALLRGQRDVARAHFEAALAQSEGAGNVRLSLRALDNLVGVLDGAGLRALRPKLEWALDQGESLDIVEGGPALHFGLARALGPDSARARELAQTAREQLLDRPAQAQLLATIEVWLGHARAE